ncbi:phosphoenolpyruvate synthase [Planomonospora sp. ID67723]|uniref:PEP/pyruvate-binding domain-containing protein n=1 Tax=Planomonospora sp. ID67723 TaxID=2738134 RepID=UPI0018C3DDC4|nr:PEP/pyruvate-binding domain-containing protein [Planomonospora sp. ID67723]MBG0828613.1 phosphoenolpyruvate synthase [Planomonospora sp. ID67723]
MDAPLILKFDEIAAGSLPLVGGKAANLGVLTAAGFPVPPGVCLTTEAYRRITERSGSLEAVFDSLDVTPADDTEALRELAATARKIVLAAPVPDDIAEAVRHSAHGPVAVRSSATAEDLPHASFAGQQDTYLHVIGPDAVLDAVRRCWASLWTDRAVAYRAANGIGHRSVRLAVVIQEMVEAEVAGVMFTANPVTGRRREAVIDASPGLGEAVVSGAVNPDRFTVDIATGRVTDRRLGDKRLAVRPLPGGGVEHVETARDVTAEITPEAACLTDDQVRALAALGGRVEDHYGAPQDTEWALAPDGTLWLTQSRPITTLFPIPRHSPADPPPADIRIYFSISVGQGVFQPFTPMGQQIFRLLSSAGAEVFGVPVADPLEGAPRFAVGGGRLFFDFTEVMRSRAGREIVPRLLDMMEARSAVILRELARDPRFGVTQRSIRPALRRALRIAARYRIPARLARALLSPAAAHRSAARVEAALRTRLDFPQDATPLERLGRVERALAAEAFPLIPAILPSAMAGLSMFGLAHRLLGDRARPGELYTVLRGLPHNVTTEMDLALWRLAARIRKDEQAASLLLTTPAAELAARFHAGSLPAVVDGGLREFLRRYGVRAVAEIDLGVPRWSEDPSHIIGVLANYLRLDDPALAPDAAFARGAAEAALMIKTLSARAGGLRGRAVRFALGRVRALAGLRELPKFLMVTTFSAMRSELRAVGAELTARGVLDSPDDVFFLTLKEVRAALAAGSAPDEATPSPAASSPAVPRALVAERRQEAAREWRRRHVPRVILSDGTEPEAVSASSSADRAADGVLTGTPASAGTVTGRARVVLDPAGARLEPGEILVCPSTDPGWTPLFLTAGGLVMEMGGANSHGAVVAREYGIPAVVGVARATEHVVTGQEVTVDGASGTVAAAPPAPRDMERQRIT